MCGIVGQLGKVAQGTMLGAQSWGKGWSEDTADIDASQRAMPGVCAMCERDVGSK